MGIETTARIAADNGEAAARIAADTALGVNLAAEIAARTAADTGMVHVADFQGGAQNLSQNGYQRLPGGLIMQWFGGLAPLQATTYFSYPIAFPTASIGFAASLGYIIPLTTIPYGFGAGMNDHLGYWVTMSGQPAGPLGFSGIAIGY